MSLRPKVKLRVTAFVGVLAVLAATTVGSAPAGAADGSSSSVTKNKTVTRTFTDNGDTTTVEKNDVSFTVDQTKDLHSLQLVHVSWKGAKPTSGLVADENSNLAQTQEHPFAIFECRGTDTAARPITPNTCWTQYADERFAYGSDDPPYPAWRSDSKATSEQRAPFVNAPAKLPADCASNLSGSTTQRWVPFASADGTTYQGGLFGCAGLPPEAAAFNQGSNLALPSNETFGVTGSDGSGSTNFDIFTGEDHASLGCSRSVACSIVAVPIEGLSCDPSGSLLPPTDRPDADGADAAKQSCETKARYAPGASLPSQGAGRKAVSGYYWWSPSNWDNRISVPLTFAPPDNACSLSSSQAEADVYGSELMIQAGLSWAPHFCLNKSLFNFTHVQLPEPQARNLLAINNVEAAFTSQPPDASSPYPSPTVNAPTAVSGFGIGVNIDDKNGRPATNVRLDARLLAKLITESYPAEEFIKDGDKGLGDNPLNISQDPEFQALNPTIPISSAGAAATLLGLNTDSDVTYALTSYINADPEARAWLNGEADPWGMKVNPAYKSYQLPVNNIELRDAYEPLEEYKPGRIDCLQDAPVPYLPLVAAPTHALFTIGQAVQFAIAQTQTKCVLPSPNPGSTEGAKMVATGRQASGSHFMLGLVSLGDAAREGVSVASLQSHVDGTPTGKFSNGDGRSFADADKTGLQAAAKTLVANEKTGVWPVPYDKLQSDSANSNAYPGLMVVYTAVPTSGLPNGDGARYAKLLDFAAGDGQVQGTQQGQLPPGYLPMTSGNGLGQLVSYTRRSALAVGAQRGFLPSLTHADQGSVAKGNGDGGSSGGSNGSGNGGSGGDSVGGGGGSAAGSTAGPATPGGAAGAPTPGKTGATTTPGGSQAQPAVAALKTGRVGSGIGGWALPAMLLLFIVALGGSVAVRLRSGRQ